MRRILSLLLTIITPFLSFGQFNEYEQPDSLFQFYKAPIIEDSVIAKLKKDDAIIYIGCYLTTDTERKITSQKFVSFYNIGNSYLSSCGIWQSIMASIATASKDWVFKPVLWHFKENESDSNLNKVAVQRPFNGRPNYFIIFEISGIDGSFIHKISFIKMPVN